MTPLTKRLAIVLAISVAINLLLAGILLGRRFDRRYGPHADRGLTAEHGPAVMRNRAFHQLIKESKLDLKARSESTRAARAAVKAALQREPFDRAALEQSFRALRAETSSSQQALHDALVEAADKGGPETRRRIAEAFTRPKRGKR